MNERIDPKPQQPEQLEQLILEFLLEEQDLPSLEHYPEQFRFRVKLWQYYKQSKNMEIGDPKI